MSKKKTMCNIINLLCIGIDETIDVHASKSVVSESNSAYLSDFI